MADPISLQSSPRSSSPAGTPQSAGSSTARPSSPPGGPRTAIRRKAAADRADKVANARPSSTRSAGAGGSTSTMLSTLLFRCERCFRIVCRFLRWVHDILMVSIPELYTDESPGLKVDPVVVLVLSLGFIFSVVALHSQYGRMLPDWLY